LLSQPLDELPHHPEVYVGLQQGQAHLSQGLIQVLFSDGAAAAQTAKNLLELFTQTFEHDYPDFRAIAERRQTAAQALI